jgi:exopolysaccharide biosynthesis polyprenyl glycosylphosphotransferase
VSDPALIEDRATAAPNAVLPPERRGERSEPQDSQMETYGDGRLREVPVVVEPRHRRRWAPHALTVDVAMLVLANAIFLASAAPGDLQLLFLLAFDAVALALIASWRGYARRLRLDVLDDVRMAITSTAVATMAIVSADALLYADETSAYGALRLWALAAVLLTVGRLSSDLASSWGRRNLKEGGATTIIVGAGTVGQLAASRFLDNPEFGLRPIGFLDPEPVDLNGRPLPVPLLGQNTDLAGIVEREDVECAVFAFSSASHDAFLGLIDECEELGVRTLVVPRFFERVPSKLDVTHVGGLPLLELRPTSPRSIQFAIKYALDRLAALTLLLVFAPLLAGVAVAVRLSLGRPILYRQERVSLDGTRFTMLKFRTMEAPDEDEEQEVLFDPEIAPGGVEGADRRTRLGTLLRQWSLDELPQLFNVLKGEMSMVGPRPERPEYVRYFRAHVRRYDGRLRTKAGITGWAQIHRLRGQTSIADRVEWDNYYIENFSLWLDLKILLRTIPAALRGQAD